MDGDWREIDEGSDKQGRFREVWNDKEVKDESVTISGKCQSIFSNHIGNLSYIVFHCTIQEVQPTARH